ncbi:MAG: DMT family transporter [Dehalococcoidia bacterium]
MPARSLIVLLLGVVGVSWAAPLIRLALDEGAGALAIAAIRLSIAAPVMLGVAAASGTDDIRGLPRGQAGLLVLSGLALAAHFALWVASLERTSIATGVVLVTAQPIFVSLGAWVFLRERPTRPVVAGTAIALAGAVILVSDDWGDLGTQWGNLLALLGAGAISVYVVIGRHARQQLSFTSYTSVVYAVAALGLLGGALATGDPVRGLAPEAYLFIAAMAVVSHLIGHNSINFALGAVPAGVVAVAILGEPAIAIAIAGLVTDEVPTLLELLGGTVVLSGVYVALRGARKASRPAPAAT